MRLKGLFCLFSMLTGLLLAWTFLGAAQIRPGRAAAAVHTVCPAGCDFSAIQPAINASAPGDEIRISEDEYKEHLTITRTLTLSGGWNDLFSAQSGDTTLVNPDEQNPIGHGRMITITSEVTDTLVAIDHFVIIGGNATRLEPVPPPDLPAEQPATPAGAVAWRPDLAAALAGGARLELLPVFDPSMSYEQRLQAQVKRLETLQPVRGPAAGLAANAPLTTTIMKPGYGGGIFSSGASLRLTNSILAFNVASDLGAGYGGAVAVMDAPRLEIRGCRFSGNVASSQYTGGGGAVYASFIGDNGVVIEDNQFISNQAGFGVDRKDAVSAGGGVLVEAAPGTVVARNLFQNNLSSANGTLAGGGGLELVSCRASRIQDNIFEANTSLARSRPLQTNDFGSGGGAEINASRGVLISGNRFHANVASAFLAGFGGGLSLNTSPDALVWNNRFDENWGAFRVGQWTFQYRNAAGGGMLMSTCIGAQVLTNTFSRNMAAYWQPGVEAGFSAFGGGLDARQGLDNVLVAGNVFTGNVASGNSSGYGGGLSVAYSEGSAITVQNNQILNNLASQSGSGLGGAMFASHVYLTLKSNLLQGNLASQSGAGRGGGLGSQKLSPISPPLLLANLDSNRFLDNRAQGNGGGEGGEIYLRSTAAFSLTNNLLAGSSPSADSIVKLIGAEAPEGPQRIVANNTFANPAGYTGEVVNVGDWLTVPVQIYNNIFDHGDTGVALDPVQYAGREIPTIIDTNLFRVEQTVDGDGAFTLTTVITGNPLFINPLTGNYRLQVDSPARDHGRSRLAPAFDLDGMPRPYGPAWDLGAYEWRQVHYYLPVVMTPICNGFACFDSFRFLSQWSPAQADPLATASARLAARLEAPLPRMLVGLDNGGWSYSPEADGRTQGGRQANLYVINHWQYVDTVYYYRHGLVTTPPVVWVNAAHRNGARMLGSVTADFEDGVNRFDELFTPANRPTSVAQLTDLAQTFGFDGWIIDLEGGAAATAEVVQAVHDLRQNGLYVVYYTDGLKSLSPSAGIHLEIANEANAWQSDYGLSSDGPETTYHTLKAQATGLPVEEAYSAAYMYSGAHGLPCGPDELNNGRECNPIQRNTFGELVKAISITAPTRGWTSLAVFAPAWPAYGGSSSWATLPAPEVWRPIDDRVWDGAPPVGPDCATTGSGGLSRWVQARTTLVSLPFVTRFNRGFGPIFSVEGIPAGSGWNHIGAQDVLPAWLCALENPAGLSLAYQDGDAWDGGTALVISGSLAAGQAGEWALWQAHIPLAKVPIVRWRFNSQNALAPSVRLTYSDNTSDLLDAPGAGSGWRPAAVAPLLSAGKTITRIAIRVSNTTAGALPVNIRLGEVAIAAADGWQAPPLASGLRIVNGRLAWQAALVPPRYSNVWALDGSLGCLAYLGPAFANEYDLGHALFPRPANVSGYIVQPVSQAGVSSPLPWPRCSPVGR